MSSEMSADEARELMRIYISSTLPAHAPVDFDDRAWHDLKASNEFLCVLFNKLLKSIEPSKRLKCRKSMFADIVEFIPEEAIDNEVEEVLDKILLVASRQC